MVQAMDEQSVSTGVPEESEQGEEEQRLNDILAHLSRRAALGYRYNLNPLQVRTLERHLRQLAYDIQLLRQGVGALQAELEDARQRWWNRRKKTG